MWNREGREDKQGSRDIELVGVRTYLGWIDELLDKQDIGDMFGVGI